MLTFTRTDHNWLEYSGPLPEVQIFTRALELHSAGIVIATGYYDPLARVRFPGNSPLLKVMPPVGTTWDNSWAFSAAQIEDDCQAEDYKDLQDTRFAAARGVL